ncbi:hypothetical protein Pcinc_032264 [Petrolisthes cinctipes]|uniref:Uncharacterized protein n=1 Tax=Petrolisthes cinctipes TaxID=88211 RepID=A0AAE1EUT6_PETCI|nr:hypothetical protein Pcinc_032264 [Petrolisthes cinctipes]
MSYKCYRGHSPGSRDHLAGWTLQSTSTEPWNLGQCFPPGPFQHSAVPVVFRGPVSFPKARYPPPRLLHSTQDVTSGGSRLPLAATGCIHPGVHPRTPPPTRPQW